MKPSVSSPSAPPPSEPSNLPRKQKTRTSSFPPASTSAAPERCSPTSISPNRACSFWSAPSPAAISPSPPTTTLSPSVTASSPTATACSSFESEAADLHRMLRRFNRKENRHHLPGPRLEFLHACLAPGIPKHHVRKMRCVEPDVQYGPFSPARLHHKLPSRTRPVSPH